MQLKYHGVSYEYNPPQVAYPGSSTLSAVREQARLQVLVDRERAENRQRSILMRALQNIGPAINISNYPDHAAFS